MISNGEKSSYLHLPALPLCFSTLARSCCAVANAKKYQRVYLDIMVRCRSGKADSTTVVPIINLAFALIKMVFQRSRGAESAHLCLFVLRYI